MLPVRIPAFILAIACAAGLALLLAGSRANARSRQAPPASLMRGDCDPLSFPLYRNF